MALLIRTALLKDNNYYTALRCLAKKMEKLPHFNFNQKKKCNKKETVPADICLMQQMQKCAFYCHPKFPFKSE